ncbi:MAG: alanine racemase, partial [Eggerthellaceae bacterium]|nr:alanine racemase [Eggerthellaceae bacterium]
IKDIVGIATLIHSVFELNHAEKINALAAERGIVQDILVEVNVSGEESKSGVTPKDAHELVRELASFDNIRVRGLMTMAPQGDPKAADACFEGLAKLLGDIKGELPADKSECFSELSMGMSEDWREAIAHGATIVRIGRAIFSEDFS